MIGRPIFFASMLGAAVGIPYLASGAKQSLSSSGGVLNGLLSQSDPKPATTPPVAGQQNAQQEQNPPAITERVRQPHLEAPLEGFNAYQLTDVIRFDVTPQWVYEHWSRKSTALADLDLHGVRVPLVTGTQPDDLAGSLTYYFNHQGQVERICFFGRTGDTRKLVALLTNQYQFRQEVPEIAGEQLYEVRWNGRPTSQLYVRPVPVIWASSPHANYQVELELNRPGSSRFVAPRRPPVPIPPPAAEPAPPAVRASSDSAE